ncbi:MAG: Do family serine endopeptidase [Treponema sp.]|nr:Do family serine endopeptidase [Treponema sp.]
MKRFTKNIVGAAVAAVLSFGLISFSCSGKAGASNGANTAFADTVPAVKIPADSLSVLEAMQNVFRSISEQVLPSVVEVDVTEKKTRPANPFGDLPFKFFGFPDNDEPQEYEAQGLGSGVIIRKDGKKYYVLTNNHVAGSATEISVKLNDGRKFDGKLVGADERMDVALVSFESDEAIPCATLGDSDKVQTGDICFAMGAPLGYSQSVTEGIVSATGRSGGQIGNINDFIQTDTAINQGNSGGPLLNIYGEVIGINTWIASQSGGSQGLGFAIPINNIKHAIDEFIANGKVTYGWLGVSLVEIRDEIKDSLGVKGKDGAFASQIFVDSPAFKGGMQAGDYIIELNGRAVRNVDQLVRDVGSLPANKEAKFKVIRGAKEMPLNVMITERTKEVSSSTAKLWPGFIPVPLTEDVRKKLELDNKIEGVAVTNVQAKSPAASLRLQEGDVITAVNGKKVKNLAEFYAALDLTKTKSVQFTIGSGAGSITTGTYSF